MKSFSIFKENLFTRFIYISERTASGRESSTQKKHRHHRQSSSPGERGDLEHSFVRAREDENDSDATNDDEDDECDDER